MPSRFALRLTVAMAAVILLSLASAGTAAAARGHGGGGGGGSGTGPGYDISWPQCGGTYPASPAFGIVGVNAGIVFSPNPCLADEIIWALGAPAQPVQLYANTGNPGPELSSHWPDGQTANGRTCDAVNDDTADCAYVYGWNAAEDSYATAATAWSSLGLAGSPAWSPWWLDVETGNSWRTDTALNVAALSGAVAYFTSVGVTRLGFYSTTVQWGEITGGTTAFAANPSWGAGAPSEAIAKKHCRSTPGFTGGPLAMVQYPNSGFDADLVC
jgi:hypothetical protein